MSKEANEVIDNIVQSSVWIRVLFMAAFAVASYFILLPLIIVLSIAQALFMLITAQNNANLRYFSATLALYVTQVVEYLTYLSEEKPYPFSDFPEVKDNSLDEDSATKSAKKQPRKKTNDAAKGEAKVPAENTAEKDSAAAKKTAVKSKAVKKKKVAKKKAVKKASKAVEKTVTGSGGANDSETAPG